MTESQQPKRGWFSSWREDRRAKRRQSIASRPRKHGRTGHAAAMYGSHRPYEHSGPITYGSGGGFDVGGGGCGGDGGGGGC